MPETLGAYLRKARLERNLTLEQVAQATHVRLAYLEALENDRLDLLPSAVQGRGFLRLYAGYLGIPVQPLLDLWEGKPSAAEEPSQSPQPGEKVSATDAQIPGSAASGPESGAFTSSPQEPAPATEQPEEATTPEDELLLPSQRIFREIGASLQQQRQRLGLTPEEAASATRIRSRYLLALENGDLESLPSPIHARGMLQNYSAFLGLNSEAILLRFAEGLQQRLQEKNASRRTSASQANQSHPISPPTASPSAPWRQILSPDLMISAILLVALLGFIIWGAGRISAAQQARQQTTPPPISEILAQVPTPLAETTVPTPAEAPTASPTEGQIGTLTTATAEITITPAINAPLQLNVIAQIRAWLRVVVDDKVAFEGRTIPGSVYAFGGRQRIELATGNGAALRLVFNQSDLGSPGAMGEPIVLIFTSEGVLTPTPLATQTPTVTLSPTPSPTLTPLLPTPTITPLIP